MKWEGTGTQEHTHTQSVYLASLIINPLKLSETATTKEIIKELDILYVVLKRTQSFQTVVSSGIPVVNSLECTHLIT